MRPEEKNYSEEKKISTFEKDVESVSEGTCATVVKQKKMLTRKTKRLIFFICLITLPLIQWAIMYAYVNFNTFRLAFLQYGEYGTNPTFAGFENFKFAFQYLFGGGPFPSRGYLYKNSFIFIIFSLIFKQTLSLLFSYYIYKKFAMSDFFKVILFLPSILSSLVFAQSFKILTDDVVQEYFFDGEPGHGLLTGFQEKYRFAAIIFFNMWLGFGGQMLIYSGTMSGLDESMVEAAEIDGATVMKEFWYITLPLMLSQISTFLVTGLVAFFSSQISLYDFFGPSAGFSATIGYEVYKDTLTATYYSETIGPNGAITFSQLSAVGLVESLFLIPAVTLMRWVLKKLGPKY